jgi:hypothetical protein
MEKFLEQLGFTYLTHELWKHEIFGIIQFGENTSRKEIAEAIYRSGWVHCQRNIRESLGIKVNH